MDNNRSSLPSGFVACSAVPRLDDFPRIPFVQPESASDVLYFKRNSRNIWLPEYRDDILDHLFATERKRARFSASYREPARRTQMLRTMKKWAMAFRMSRTTFHLAVYVLDHYLDGLRLDAEDKILIMMTCLLLAAKAEDTGCTRFKDLNKYLSFGYSLKDYSATEKKIVRKFCFDFCRPTIATFAEFFAGDILSRGEFEKYRATVIGGNSMFTPSTAMYMFHLSISYSSFDEMVKCMVAFAMRLTDLCLYDFILSDVAPSIVAAACIMTTRRMQFLEDWSPQLTHRTRLKEFMIEAFVYSITHLYETEMGHQKENDAVQHAAIAMQSTESEAKGVVSRPPTTKPADTQCTVYVDVHPPPSVSYRSTSPARFQATSLFTGLRVTGLTQRDDQPFKASDSPNYQMTTLLSHDTSAAGSDFKAFRQPHDKANTALLYPDSVLLAESAAGIPAMPKRGHDVSWLDTLDSSGNTDPDLTGGSLSNPSDTSQEYGRCAGYLAENSAGPNNSLFAKEFNGLTPDLRTLLPNDDLENHTLRNSWLALKSLNDEAINNISSTSVLPNVGKTSKMFGGPPRASGRHASKNTQTTYTATGMGCTVKFPLRQGTKSKSAQNEVNFEGKKTRKK